MYGCESWTIKKAEHQIIGTFELCCWRRLDWESCGLQGNQNQSILKEINPEYSLEKLTLKLQLQYYGHLIWRADSLEETLMPRKIEGRKRKGRQRVRWLDDIHDSMDMSWASFGSWWWTRKPGVRQSLGLRRVGHGWATKNNFLGSVTHTGSSQRKDTLLTRLCCGLLFPSDILYFLVTKMRYRQEKLKQNNKRYKLISIFSGM